jgi:hypothetical protein
VDQIYNHRRVQGRFGVSDFYSRKIDSPDWSNYRPPLKRPTPDNVDSTQDIDPISPPAHDLAACLQSAEVDKSTANKSNQRRKVLDDIRITLAVWLAFRPIYVLN